MSLLAKKDFSSKLLHQKSSPFTCFSIRRNVAHGRKTSRLYNRCVSWQLEKHSLGLQLLRVDLTTAKGRSSHSLRRHFQELKRRVDRRYGYDLDTFVVETDEAHGVLHMLWAIEAKKSAWIDQRWLSAEWQKIHGSKIVFIKRAQQKKSDRRRISRYFASQGDHGSAVVRFSYSWRKTRLPLGAGWAFLKRKFRKLRREHPALRFKNLIDAWSDLVTTGRCVLSSLSMCVINREIYAKG